MTEPEIAALGPAFAAYLRRFRRCFRQDRTAGHFDTYCRGLLTDLRAHPVASAETVPHLRTRWTAATGKA